MLLRFIKDDGGQDLIEYGLLAGLIGVAAVASWINIPPLIRAAYENWDASVQTASSCTPDPGGGGC
jgi:Flp pilus assembly pilin Flp